VCEACYLRFSAPQLGALQPPEKQRRAGRKSAPCIPGVAAAEPPAEPEPFVGTQDLEPIRLRWRRQATAKKIEVQQAEEDARSFEQLQRERQERQRHAPRAKSCPRLLACSPGPAVWPPAPVLFSQGPRAPLGAPPRGVASAANLRAERSQQHAPVASPAPPARKAAPPVRGAPYLREVQAFTAKCSGRAGEVLGPAAFETLSGKAINQAAAGVLPAAEAKAPPVTLTMEVDVAEASQEEAVEEAQEDEPHVDIDDGDSDGSCVEEDGSDSEPIVAQLWGKWPPSCGSRSEYDKGGRSDAASTRPPSQGEPGYSRTSSYPGSGPSTRPSSRGALGSARRKSLASLSYQEVALQQLRARSRPASSPQIRRPPVTGEAALGSWQYSPREKTPLKRPESSPLVRPGSGFQRPVSLRGSGTPPELRRAASPPSPSPRLARAQPTPRPRSAARSGARSGEADVVLT